MFSQEVIYLMNHPFRPRRKCARGRPAGKKACEEVEEVTGEEDGKTEGTSDIVVSRFGSISHSPFLRNFVCYP